MGKKKLPIEANLRQIVILGTPLLSKKKEGFEAKLWINEKADYLRTKVESGGGAKIWKEEIGNSERWLVVK